MKSVTNTFDTLLVLTATVLRKTDQTAGDYGLQDQAFAVIATGVPCLVSTKALGRPHEFKKDKKLADQFVTVYMRPYKGAGAPLTVHDWLQVTDVNGVLHTYDIFKIADPSVVGHHFEIICEEIIP